MFQITGCSVAAAFVARERSAPYGPARTLATAARGAADAGPAEHDLEVVETLGDEIATLAAHIHAATHQLLVLLARFDHLRGWELEGHRSCAHWLAFRTGIDLGAAREKVRAARALEELAETSAAMARGELSFSQVRALTRIATADNEAELLELTGGSTTAQIERVVRGWKRGNREDQEARERERHDNRTLSVFPDHDGMYVVRGKLPPEVGALLMRAIEAASDALYREEAGVERLTGCSSSADTLRAAARRRADALGLLVERALEAGFGERAGGSEDRTEASVPISGTRAGRYQVVLHVDALTLAEAGGTLNDSAVASGRSELEDGTRVSGETSRRLSCDATLVPVTHGPDGSVLDVGRRTRTIPSALRRALEARDRGCRFPDHSPSASGARGLRFCDAHHVRHWADGGQTSLGNTVLLCRHHHRLVHEGGWKVLWDDEARPAFVDPRGGTHYDGRWRLPELPDDPVRSLVQHNRARGAHPDWRTAGARWKRCGR